MKKQFFSFKQCIGLLIFMSIGIFACQHDITMPLPQQIKEAPISTLSAADNVAIEDAKLWFEKNYASITNPSIKIEPVWQRALVHGNTIEVPYLLNGLMIRPKLKKNGAFGMQNLILAKKTDDKYKIFSMSYAPKETYLSRMKEINYANYHQKLFDGNIIVSNLDFRVLKSYMFEKGKLVNTEKLKKVDRNDMNLRGEICYNDIVFAGCTSICIENWVRGIYYGDYCFSECFWETVYTCEDDGLGNDCPGYPWCDDDDDDCPGNPECDDDGCGGCPGDEDDAIDGVIINLEPCHSTIWNKIDANDPNLSDMSSWIERFRGDLNESISISDGPFTDGSGNEDDSTDGSAEYDPINHTYVIKINTAVSRFSSQEYTAATILHEIIHAYLGAYMNVERSNGAQHPRMVYDYCVDWMASKLMSLYPNLTLAQATGLAWVGLQKDVPGAYNALPEELRASYSLANTMFRSGSSGTPPSPPCTE
jgi:hypothetical protein